MTIEQADQRCTQTGRILDWVRADYRSLTLPPEDRPSLAELEQAEENYSQAMRDFHALGGIEALLRQQGGSPG